MFFILRHANDTSDGLWRWCAQSAFEIAAPSTIGVCDAFTYDVTVKPPADVIAIGEGDDLDAWLLTQGWQRIPAPPKGI